MAYPTQAYHWYTVAGMALRCTATGTLRTSWGVPAPLAMGPGYMCARRPATWRPTGGTVLLGGTPARPAARRWLAVR